MGLPYDEEIMIVGRITWAQFTIVADRQTDRQMDRLTTTKNAHRAVKTAKINIK